jgi:hypothetical protein
MNSKLQGENEILVHAAPERIWAILEDSQANLPHVLPMVRTCELDSGGHERVGAVRTCSVDFGSKRGVTVERCIECVRNKSLAHRIESDSFGFSRALSDFWFAFSLEPENGATLVRIETHYDPRGLIGRLMSVLMAKRQFRSVRVSALENLKRLAEGGAEGS